MGVWAHVAMAADSLINVELLNKNYQLTIFLICVLCVRRLLIMKSDSMKHRNGFAHLLKQWTGMQLSIRVSQSSLTILRAGMKKVCVLLFRCFLASGIKLQV